MGFKDFVKKEKEREVQVIQQAFEQTPKEYHPFLTLLEQNKAVANREIPLTPDLEELGAFAYGGKTYLKIKTRSPFHRQISQMGLSERFLLHSPAPA